MDCKVIVNQDSGNCKRLNLQALLDRLQCGWDCVQFVDANSNWSSEKSNTVVVCGGDGTLKNAINNCPRQQVLFVPCGTLNESKRLGNSISSVGSINGQLFSYVCAVGSFTQIGYCAKKSIKQKIKWLAYLPEVLKSYKCHQIDATISTKGKQFEGQYTLIMALRGKQCFGLKFNKIKDNGQSLYLLAVKSFGKNNLANKVKMLLTFFRVFFWGIRKPLFKGKVLFCPIDEATVKLRYPQDFCLDGERCTLGDKLHICQKKLEKPIQVLKMPRKKSYRK